MGRFRTSRLRPLSIVLGAVLLLVVGFGAGVSADRARLLPWPAVHEPADAAPYFGVFWQTWDLVEKRYVDRSAVDPRRMTYGAVQGMLDSLGDAGHTRFLSPQDWQMEQQALSGKVEGIGAELVMREGRPTILAPIPGSPAQRAGLRPGDVIVRVNGKDVAGQTLDQIVNQVRGPAGTEVTLTVIHLGASTLSDVKVIRAQITVPSVSWARLPGTAVAHVLISQFGENATDELVAALQAARSGGATAIILDLRNDPGGLRDEAIRVASQFLKEGNVLLEQDAQGQRTPLSVQPGGVALDVPLVVLVNEGTASSAEIVAGALQDHRRAPIVGTSTVGTGTVLSIHRLSDGSAVFLGTREWFTPNGRQIWHHGITPDVQVALPVGAVPLLPQEEAGLTPEQLKSGQDTQLLRALQEVTQPAPSR